MSHAVRAAILIRLEANLGQWVSVEALAEYLALPEAEVRFQLPVMRYEKQALLQYDERGTILAAQAVRHEEPACA